jgi:hypothetical protein
MYEKAYVAGLLQAWHRSLRRTLVLYINADPAV